MEDRQAQPPPRESDSEGLKPPLVDAAASDPVSQLVINIASTVSGVDEVMKKAMEDAQAAMKKAMEDHKSAVSLRVAWLVHVYLCKPIILYI